VTNEDQLAGGGAQGDADFLRQRGDVEYRLPVEAKRAECGAGKNLPFVHSLSSTMFFSPIRRCATQTSRASMAAAPACALG
jgi:hypothetical protein